MKKLWSILLVVVLVLSCATVHAEEAFAKYEEPITIIMARAMGSDVHFDENDPARKSYEENRWINAYADKLGINVEYQWIASDEEANDTKWITALASGTLPDAGYVSNSVYAMLLEAGVIADMTDIFAQYASEDYRNAINADMLKQVTFDGRIYGLPYSAKGYQGGSGLFIRKDWLDQLGLSVPETVDDVVKIARAFVEAKLGGDDTIGILLGNKPDATAGSWAGLFNPYGAYLNIWTKNADGKLEFSNVNSNMKDALLFAQKLYQEKLINQDFVSTTDDLATEYIVSGKCGIIYGVSWLPVTAIQSLMNSDQNAEIVSLTIPGLTGSDTAFQANAPSVPKIFVNKNCKHPEAVVKLVNLSIDLVWNDANNYYRDADGFSWFKYLVFNDFFSMGAEIMQTAAEITEAEKTGVVKFTNPQWESVYQKYINAKSGERSLIWHTMLYGENGLYMQYKDAYEKELIVTDEFYGLDTETMALKKTILNEALMTAIMEVMMGADISVYENAVAAWYANGGQQITDEVNAWAQNK